jgi:uncharacterized membrane protein (DUF485 family)
VALRVVGRYVRPHCRFATPHAARQEEIVVSTESGVPKPTPFEQRYIDVQKSPEFQDLRKRYRGFVLPVTAVSVLWYFLYVGLAAYATDFMGTKLFGNINVGLVLGILQFITTFAVTSVYVRYADRVLDPRSAAIRDTMEEKGLL